MVKEYIRDLEDQNENTLLFIASHARFSDDYRLAAALLLCTCDSNERKAGE